MMAAAYPYCFSNPIDIKDIIVCVLCRENISSELVQLQCFHLCHKSCVKIILCDNAPGSNICCPECRRISKIPQHETDSLPAELLQYKMKEIADIYSNSSPSCKMCEAVYSETPSTHFCVSCKVYLCTSDVKRHQVTPHHTIIANTEIHTEKYLPEVLTSPKTCCEIHSSAADSKVLEYYCKKCLAPVCQICNGTTHKFHETTSLHEASKQLQEEMTISVKEMSEPKKYCLENLDLLENLQNEIEANSKDCIVKCNEWREDFKMFIDCMADQCVNEIENSSKAQKKEITQVMNEQMYGSKQFQYAEDYMSVFLTFGSKSDFLQKHNIYMENLKSCLRQDLSADICVKKFKVHSTSVDGVQEDLSKMLSLESFTESHKIGKQKMIGCELESKWEQPECRIGIAVDGENIIAVRGENIEVFGMAGNRKREIKNSDIKWAFDVDIYDNEYYISDIDKDRREVVVISQNGKVKHRIRLPQQEKGINGYALGVAIDQSNGDVYICSSKTHKVYKYSKGQASAQPYITHGLNHPKYLCVTRGHGLIVSNRNSHSISKFNSEGRLVWTYGTKGKGKGQLFGPRKVCLDPWGQIFVADFWNHRIHHLSVDGQLLSYVDIGEKIVRPQAIVFKDQKLFITSGAPYRIYIIKCKYD